MMFSEGGIRRVAQTDIGESHISTVFLSHNHAFDGGTPILFETLVFNGPLDGEMDRYCTWEEAEQGHRNMVDRVQAEPPRIALPPPAAAPGDREDSNA